MPDRSSSSKATESYAKILARPVLLLAILAGAFNPPTRAHLAMADAALAVVDEVLFTLPRAFPHKEFTRAEFETRDPEANAQFLIEKIKDAYQRKSSHEEATAVKSLERYIILNAIDRLWQEHLYAMDALRECVYLRSYAQKDPLIEYKTEAYDMFVELMANIKNEVLHNLFRSTSNLQAFENFLATLPQFLLRENTPTAPTATGPVPGRHGERLGASDSVSENGENPEIKLDLAPVRREIPKVGRNESCPCGSGKKFKNCCGRSA